jgi:hypothetical protein
MPLHLTKRSATPAALRCPQIGRLMALAVRLGA